VKLRASIEWWEGESRTTKTLLEIEIVNDMERCELQRTIEEGLRSVPGSWVVVQNLDEEG
jgi:hypothetical protein